MPLVAASFRPQVLNCFKAIETSYLMGGYSRVIAIHVHPFHPLYSHVKAAAKASVVKEEKLFAAQRAKARKVGRMSTLRPRKRPHPRGARFTKIYDEHGNHIITRDEATGLEWLA